MALFSRKTKKKEIKKEAPEKLLKKKIDEVAISEKGRSLHFSHILIRPLVTEKSHYISEKGEYAFFVDFFSTKADVKKAIEEIYGVHVRKITTAKMKPKKRIRGKQIGYTKKMKKAMVSLKKGETITLFEGV